MRRVCTLAVMAAAASAATADTYTDTFDNGTNAGNWGFIHGFDSIEDSGGNPGWYLRQPAFDTFAPILSGDQGPFIGDYRAMGVTQISVDAITYHRDFGPPEGFEFSLLLRDTKDTPEVDDDDYAYYVGDEVPQPGQGWKSFAFDVPSDSGDLPAGWKGGWVGDGENFRPGVTWSDVITNVKQVEFWWINPTFFAFFANWDVGVDNPAITTIPAPASAGLLALGALAGGRRRR
ncbi:MAG TPA: hypothetical protein VFF69_00675 [Phycisphaerales bacterium]|nr:hypothetical protein [Phycisphaerales bacterium]